MCHSPTVVENSWIFDMGTKGWDPRQKEILVLVLLENHII